MRVTPAGLILCLCSFLIALPASATEAVDTLLAKVSDAYGGNTVNGIKGMRQTGVTYSAMHGGEGTILRAYQHPDRLRIEINYPGKPELRIIRGPQSWIHGKAMSGPFHASMILQATRMGLPWNLLENRAQLRDAGTLKLEDGHTLHAIEMPLALGYSLVVDIDPESGRILRSRGIMPSAKGTMEFATVYEDFKSQGGRLYAAMEQHYALGRHIGYTKIEKIEFTDVLPEDLFEPPAKLDLKDPDQGMRL